MRLEPKRQSFAGELERPAEVELATEGKDPDSQAAARREVQHCNGRYSGSCFLRGAGPDCFDIERHVIGELISSPGQALELSIANWSWFWHVDN
jgi:hypothetical protein